MSEENKREESDNLIVGEKVENEGKSSAFDFSGFAREDKFSKFGEDENEKNIVNSNKENPFYEDEMLFSFEDWDHSYNNDANYVLDSQDNFVDNEDENVETLELRDESFNDFAEKGNENFSDDSSVDDSELDYKVLEDTDNESIENFNESINGNIEVNDESNNSSNDVLVNNESTGSELDSFSENTDTNFNESINETTNNKSNNEKNNINSGTNIPKSFNIKNKLYISFEERVAVSVLVVIALFFSSCFLIYKAITFSQPQKVTYEEKSDVAYSVCLNSNDFYNESCLNENMKYISELTNKINANFKYNVAFSEDVEYDLAYHVVGVTRINDGVNTEQNLYENEEVLLEKTNIANTKDSIDIDTNVLIDYKRFNNYVSVYKSRYQLNVIATLEVILYLDEPNETRKVASLVIPLNAPTFFINKNAIVGKKKVVEIEGKVWNKNTIICSVFAITSLIIALIILFRTTSMVLKATSKRNNYQNVLNQILTEYDSMIVIARDGYVSNVEKQVIKVDSFKELLDAKNNLQKPIIYSKINNIKSEFIVEDIEVLYKFTLKEADLEEE